MGRALSVVSGRVTNPGATISALTANTGDSFTVRNFDQAKAAHLEDMWTQQATAGVFRIRSPRMHDAAQGIRLRTLAGNARPLLTPEAAQLLYPQDLLTVEQSGGGAEIDAAAYMVYYDDIPGINARLHAWSEIGPLIKNVTTVECDLTTGGTGGQYGGSQALNANFDTLKRNIDYAVMGYVTDTQMLLVGLTGPDTGNLRIGGPAPVAPDVTADWFIQLDKAFGRPHIPVFNAANIAATTVDCVSTATGVSVNVAFIVAELAHNLTN